MHRAGLPCPADAYGCRAPGNSTARAKHNLIEKASMSTDNIGGVNIATRANVYFDGKCVSHGLTLPDGSRKSVGVVLPATLRFSTATAEIMECVAGACEYLLDGEQEWRRSGPGESFSVAASSSFQIRVTDAYHYICHFG